MRKNSSSPSPTINPPSYFIFITGAACLITINLANAFRNINVNEMYGSIGLLVTVEAKKLHNLFSEHFIRGDDSLVFVRAMLQK